MADELEFGDWVIQVIRNKDKNVVVHPPGQLRFTDTYCRGPGTSKERWVFHLEIPRRGERIAWKKFYRSAKAATGNFALAKPRTIAVRDVAIADALLGLWTPGGRIARR